MVHRWLKVVGLQFIFLSDNPFWLKVCENGLNHILEVSTNYLYAENSRTHPQESAAKAGLEPTSSPWGWQSIKGERFYKSQKCSTYAILWLFGVLKSRFQNPNWPCQILLEGMKCGNWWLPRSVGRRFHNLSSLPLGSVQFCWLQGTNAKMPTTIGITKSSCTSTVDCSFCATFNDSIQAGKRAGPNSKRTMKCQTLKAKPVCP